MSKSVLDDAEDENFQGRIPIPEFHCEWECEYVSRAFDTSIFRVASLFMGIYFCYDFIKNIFFPELSDGTGGNSEWVVATWIPELMSGIFCCSSAIALCGEMIFFQNHYHFMCIISISLVYINFVWSQLFIEIRRARFQRKGFEQIHWSIEFSQFLPVRTCNDSDPVKTWTDTSNLDVGMSIGCEIRTLSGTLFPIYVFLSLSPVIFRMKPRAAALLACFKAVCFAIATLAVGGRGLSVATGVLFQLAAGLGAAHFCWVQETAARRQFALSKAIRAAGGRSRDLLHTLIPQNVAERVVLADRAVAGGDGGGGGGGGGRADETMVGRLVPMCTIMFCAVDGGEALHDAFSEDVFALLHDLFSGFDAAVHHHGLFKYQHVQVPRPATDSECRRVFGRVVGGCSAAEYSRPTVKMSVDRIHC
jgi:hypothetical protein